MSQELLSAQDEFDVSDAGTPTLTGVVATITDFSVSEKENGVQHEVEFTVEGLGFPIRRGYWFTHSNPKAQGAGRGQLKRIAMSALGTPAYNSTNLIGTKLVVDVGENDSGFAEVKKIRKYEASE